MTHRISLRKECEEFVQRMIDSGRYQSISDVIDGALRHFEDRERYREAKLEALRAEIQKGFDSGPAIEVTDTRAWVEEIKARGRRRLAERDAAE